MKLSIIIPYYDTYDLTVQLLDVLEPQVKRHEDVEVILIDDGCQEFRLDKYQSIKITHLNKNHGASHAWNVGLEQAIGKYIGFIDSDDMITDNYIDTLLYLIDKENADEIIFSFNRKTFNSITCDSDIPAIWKGIYKRWLVIPFDETKKYHTDMPFFRHRKNTTHTISCVPILLYHYNNVREGSITWKYKRNLFKEE